MCVVSDAQGASLVLTSEPSPSSGPFCQGRVQFTCRGTEVPIVLNWFVNDSIFATYSFANIDTYPRPFDPEPPASSFPPGVVVNVTSAAMNPNVPASIDITTILDVSDVSVLNQSSLFCQDFIPLTRSNQLDIKVCFRGEYIHVIHTLRRTCTHILGIMIEIKCYCIKINSVVLHLVFCRGMAEAVKFSSNNS